MVHITVMTVHIHTLHKSVYIPFVFHHSFWEVETSFSTFPQNNSFPSGFSLQPISWATLLSIILNPFLQNLQYTSFCFPWTFFKCFFTLGPSKCNITVRMSVGYFLWSGKCCDLCPSIPLFDISPFPQISHLYRTFPKWNFATWWAGFLLITNSCYTVHKTNHPFLYPWLSLPPSKDISTPLLLPFLWSLTLINFPLPFAVRPTASITQNSFNCFSHSLSLSYSSLEIDTVFSLDSCAGGSAIMFWAKLPPTTSFLSNLSITSTVSS